VENLFLHIGKDILENSDLTQSIETTNALSCKLKRCF